MNKNRERGKIDWMITLLPLTIIIALCILFFFAPEQSNAVLSQIRFFFGDTFGTYYLVIGLGIFILSLYIACSKYGNIVLGEPNEKPQYSFFAWGSMMFTCGLAADILFYSFSEWVLYATDPHLAEMGSIQDWAGVYPLFHWSFIPWGFYLVLAVAFGFMLHVRKRTRQKYSEACRPILGKHTDHRDGTADTDMYFDANGNPRALSKGQYGIKRSGKVNLLLDRNGNIMLCVDNFLNGFPCMVVVFGCVICILMLGLPRNMSTLLTISYVVFILYETLMFRESGDARTNVVLFSYAGKFLKEQSVRVGVINNIWLFIPLGTGLYTWFQKKWVLLIPFVMSMAIETTQYITGLGIAEFDDVFGNTMGGWIGVLVAWTWLSRKMSLKNRA